MSLLPQPSGAGDAVVLRAWPTGETSVVASLLTAEHGGLRVLAKGARQQASRLRPLVRPGMLASLEFGLAPGRELQYLRGGTVRLDPLAGGGLERAAFLLAALEIVDRCRPGGGRDGRLFALCHDYLRVLSCAPRGGEAPVFYAFELSLLRLQGVAPVLDACAACGAALGAGDPVGFGPACGGLLCAACLGGEAGWPLAPETVADLRRLAAAPPAGPASGPADPRIRRQVGIALHRFLEHHLPNYRLPSALDLLRRRPPPPRDRDVRREESRP